MKKIIGYGTKLSSESIRHAMSYYWPYDLLKSKAQALKRIEKDKAEDLIPKASKPKVFKIIVEVEE